MRAPHRMMLVLAVLILTVVAVNQASATPAKKIKPKQELGTTLDHAGPALSPSQALVSTPVLTVRDPGFYAGLPVGSVDVRPTDRSWGTVVLLPQYHQHPGSNVDDAVNDRAQRTQEESYAILQKLTHDGNTHLVMVEGEIAGDVPVAKTQRLTALVQERDTFRTRLDGVVQSFGALPSEATRVARVKKSGEKLLASVDRQIALAGAPQWAAATGAPIRLVGSENPDTLAQSRDVVRTYIYAQDRLAQLGGGTSTAALGGSFVETMLSSQLQQLLKKARAENTDIDLSRLQREAPDANSAENVRTLRDAWQALSQTRSMRDAPAQSTTATTRSDNPFAGIQNPAALRKIVTQQEQKIQELVITRRNTETAENFARALRSHDVTTGILQFGAGHEDGLTRELNKVGLSVIVVRPAEVERAR